MIVNYIFYKKVAEYECEFCKADVPDEPGGKKFAEVYSDYWDRPYKEPGLITVTVDGGVPKSYEVTKRYVKMAHPAYESDKPDGIFMLCKEVK